MVAGKGVIVLVPPQNLANDAQCDCSAATPTLIGLVVVGALRVAFFCSPDKASGAESLSYII